MVVVKIYTLNKSIGSKTLYRKDILLFGVILLWRVERTDHYP